MWEEILAARAAEERRQHSIASLHLHHAARIIQVSVEVGVWRGMGYEWGWGYEGKKTVHVSRYWMRAGVHL